jgi:hypothetical protein
VLALPVGWQSYGWQWSPILDTAALKRNKLDAYWPVGVLESKLMYTLLKVRMYPGAACLSAIRLKQSFSLTFA